MSVGLLGQKVGMTQIFDKESGKVIPVTVLKVGPCPVLQVRDQERDGYDAVQVGYQDKKRTKATRAERGHVASDLVSKRRKKREGNSTMREAPPKADCEPQRYIREFRLQSPAEVKVGDLLIASDVFQEQQKVDVIGTSKGRGYSGAMKRHNFGGLRASHGAKKVHRSAGSIASHCSNRGHGRPKKGHKAAGQYGNTRITVRNLEIVMIDEENHVICVRGAVPGPNGGFIQIQPTKKLRKSVPA